MADEQYQIKRLAREFLKDIMRTGKDGKFAAQEYYDGGMWGMLYYAYMRGDITEDEMEKLGNLKKLAYVGCHRKERW